MPQVGFTKPGINFPAYVNAQRDDGSETVRLLIRGWGSNLAPGNTAAIDLTVDELERFIADARAAGILRPGVLAAA